MPHHLKYAEAHSGTTLDRPSRANLRTSSKASQGFFSRFRRSMRWALVSLCGISLIAFLRLLVFRIQNRLQKRNARVSFCCTRAIWEAGLDFWTSTEATYATRAACIEQRQQAITSID